VELQHALAVEPSDIELNEDNLTEVKDIVSVCAGLVTVDEESGVIRLVHYTTQEFFERTQNDWFPTAEIDITRICVTYLSFRIFKSGFCKTDNEFEERLHSNHLYQYAAQNWGYHDYKASNISQAVVDFLDGKAEVEASSQALLAIKRYSTHSYYSQEVPRQMTGLHLAAYFGLEKTINTLLKKGVKVNSADSDSWTSLSYAAANGHEGVVKLLLATEGVNTDSKNK
jgi:ankyrin repeat protein